MKTRPQPQRLNNAAVMRIDLVRLSPDATLREAVQAMTRARARYAIVEEDGRFLGLVSDRDLRLALPSRLLHTARESQDLLDGETVRSVCIRRPYIAHPEGSAATSARLMIEHRIGCLPVIDESGQIHGLVTLDDFARLFAGLFTQAGSAQSVPAHA